MVNTLIERWYPDIHIFHLPVGECVVTLEDVVIILDLLTNGLPVTGVTMSSHDILKAECLQQFGVALKKTDCRGSFIKLTWLWNLKDHLDLIDENSIQRYLKCYIILLFGTILFGGKFGAVVQ
ncbi:protein MAIN-LIKE 2-like [Arachis hypogaea]|uniref:protein MAIN-LIKE 2-like n=1 Tax=Arachis hypogaea TaxID=3818 RepID=UPI000DEC7716|nr:protein MAIN-LIKE 2-like [Arachis hypogaea]